MSKWNRYRRIQVVDVMFFEKPSDPSKPQYPIETAGCHCEPQDGYTCNECRGKYDYVYRAIDRRVSIRPGEYLVRFSNGQAITASPEEFGESYEPETGR